LSTLHTYSKFFSIANIYFSLNIEEYARKSVKEMKKTVKKKNTKKMKMEEGSKKKNTE